MSDKSIFGSLLGTRSLTSWLFGGFFQQTTNTSGLLALVLVGSSLYTFAKRGTLPDWLIAALFAVIGFYFGGASKSHAHPVHDQDPN